jgi:hypothetical protein
MIFAHTALVVATLHQVIRMLPIVLVSTLDPVANGYVVSLAHPGGTGTLRTLPIPLRETRP